MGGFIKKFLNIYSMFYEHVMINVVYKAVPPYDLEDNKYFKYNFILSIRHY